MAINVTAADYANEKLVIDTLINDFGYHRQSLTHHADKETHAYDADIKSGSGRWIMAEIRTRKNYSGESLNNMGGVWINCDKFWSVVKLARNSSRVFGLFVQCSDRLWASPLYEPEWTDDHFIETVRSYPITPAKRKVVRKGQEMNDKCFVYNIPLGELVVSKNET